MGFYIQAPDGTLFGKAEYFCKEYGANSIVQEEVPKLLKEGVGIVCVVSNPQFEAAAFCYNMKEYLEFSNPTDTRPKTWLTMDRDWLEEHSGFKKMNDEYPCEQ